MARDITKLHPDLQKLVASLQKECLLQGLKIGISECVRTIAEQDALYAQGRTAPGGIVTNAKGSTYSSMHQWGVAFDFYRNDGRGAYLDADGFFTKVGKIGQKLGLEWGGTWKSPVDKPHFQLPDWGSTSSIIKITYGTPGNFMKTWATPTKTITAASPKEHIMWLQERVNRYSDAGIDVDGRYGPRTKQAVLNYWKRLKWNQHGRDDGTRAGKATIEALAAGRAR